MYDRGLLSGVGCRPAGKKGRRGAPLRVAAESAGLPPTLNRAERRYGIRCAVQVCLERVLSGGEDRTGGLESPPAATTQAV